MQFPSADPPLGEPRKVKTTLSSRVFDGFRRDPALLAYNKPLEMVNRKGKRYDARAAAANTANSHLARRLKNRHLQMIAIGGSIGE
jgi:amino acid transporter